MASPTPDDIQLQLLQEDAVGLDACAFLERSFKLIEAVIRLISTYLRTGSHISRSMNKEIVSKTLGDLGHEECTTLATCATEIQLSKHSFTILCLRNGFDSITRTAVYLSVWRVKLDPSSTSTGVTILGNTSLLLMR